MTSRRWVLAPDAPAPVSAEAVAEGLKLRRVSWRQGTKGKLSARFGWVRVWPGQDWKKGYCAHAEPLWLLVEARDDGQVQYALSNLPKKTSRVKAVRVWKQRWRIEMYQADYPGSRRWVCTREIGYHRRDGVARTGRVVPAATRQPRRSRRMPDTRRTAPPRA